MGFTTASAIQKSEDVDHQETANRTHDGDDISPDSVATPDINGVQQPFNLPRQAGYTTGDVLPPLSFLGVKLQETTSSDTYSLVSGGDFQATLRLADLYPDTTTLQGYLSGRVDPAGDQVDLELRDFTNSATIVERTGLTDSGNFAEGPTTYVSPDREVLGDLGLRIRNADNSTSVELTTAFVALVPQL